MFHFIYLYNHYQILIICHTMSELPPQHGSGVTGFPWQPIAAALGVTERTWQKLRSDSTTLACKMKEMKEEKPPIRMTQPNARK